MTRRYLALLLPLLPIDRLRRLEPALRKQPLATWATTGNRRLIVAVEASGLYPGQALADAQALRPDLRLYPAEPRQDAALLERLALWCLRWTPLVAVDGTDGLLLETTGTDHLFGGEASLLSVVVAGFRDGGFHLAAALAGTPGAAAALSRVMQAPLILPPGGEMAALAPLPLASLRLPADVVLGLSRIGLLTIGDVLRQPRPPLARRFGRALLDALDDATGDRIRPLRPIRPPARFMAARDLLEPIITRLAIDQVLDELLADLCRDLLAAGQGARRLLLRAFRVDRMVQELAIGTGSASREPRHLARLFADRLDALEPDLGFERMVLEAGETDPLAGVQAGLTKSSGATDASAAALAELLDRLGQRVTLSRPCPLDSHWPEYALAPGPAFGRPAPSPGWAGGVRPVRLLREPIALSVTTELRDGPPLHLRHGRTSYQVLRAIGPERLEPEWWGEDADRPARDYYRVQTAEGPRLWICRLVEPGPQPRWYLHGELA